MRQLLRLGVGHDFVRAQRFVVALVSERVPVLVFERGPRVALLAAMHPLLRLVLLLAQHVSALVSERAPVPVFELGLHVAVWQLMLGEV